LWRRAGTVVLDAELITGGMMIANASNWMKHVMMVVLLGGTATADSTRAPSAHDKFAVLDLKIGMAIDGRPGFVCAKQPDATQLADRHCVKFVDTRCKGQAANIGSLRYGQKAPLGCYLDYSNSATYLDGKLLQTPNTGDTSDTRPVLKPLMNVHIVGTKSKTAKIYRIHYMLALDELTEDSKLYGALVGKYGEPSYKNPPNEMRWRAEDTKAKASCDRASCEIVVEDEKFEALEERKQDEADSRARHQNASTPEL
jgi:hypothetical protein